MTPGHVWIVGAGPGDPGLMTVTGMRALREADVVLYDALASTALLREVRPGAELRYVGKRAGEHALTQSGIEALMVQEALAGRTVVRLKGGDPFVFGRGSEELIACQAAGLTCTVVPGITSAIAAPAYAGIPVTHRGMASEFMVITGSNAAADDESAWQAAAQTDTLVILMGASSLPQITARLINAGRDPATPAASVRWGTRPDQQSVTSTLQHLARDVEAAGLKAPMVTVVGPVAGLAESLAWFTPGPLAGRQVVVTRARAQSSDLARRLESLGAYVVEAPAIEVTLRSADPDLREALLAPATWWVFTSANGVDAVREALFAQGLDARAAAGRRIASIGEATTARLRTFGLVPDFVPSRATSRELAAELPVVDGDRVTLFQSVLSRDELAATLVDRNAQVLSVVSYDNTPVPLDAERLREIGEADVITFTSASTARNLRAALGEDAPPPAAKLVSIGPLTSDAVCECFGRVDYEAATPGIDALIEAVREVLA